MIIPYPVTVYRIAEYLENEFKIVEKGKEKNKTVICVTDQGLELTKKFSNWLLLFKKLSLNYSLI
jgi:predicted transcriptional regulator